MFMKLFSHLSVAFTLFALTCLAGGTQVEAVNILEPRSEQETESANEEEVLGMHSTSEIKGMVKDEFGDEHPMVDVARCESSFRQFANDGDVLRNPESDAIGIFQILEGLHEQPAEKLGFDIFTSEGNIGYARKLYDSFGLSPWSPSSLCWDDGTIDRTNPSDVELSNQKESTRVPVKVRSDGELEPLFGGSEQETDKQKRVKSVENKLITKKLVSGVEDPQVKDLQRLLNDIGYQLSTSGPGSAGQETDFFGAKTRAAVKGFQCQQNIVCDGGRYSTGYGLVDEETRQALNQAATYREDGMYRIGDVRVRTDDFNDEPATESSVRNENASDNSETVDQNLVQELARAHALVDELAAQINNQ